MKETEKRGENTRQNTKYLLYAIEKEEIIELFFSITINKDTDLAE